MAITNLHIHKFQILTPHISFQIQINVKAVWAAWGDDLDLIQLIRLSAIWSSPDLEKRKYKLGSKRYNILPF